MVVVAAWGKGRVWTRSVVVVVQGRVQYRVWTRSVVVRRPDGIC